MSTRPLNIAFRHASSGKRGDRWHHIVQRLMDAHLNTQPDVFVSILATHETFSIKLLYLDYMNDHTGFFRKYKIKVLV
jgi:hypothetical protein